MATGLSGMERNLTTSVPQFYAGRSIFITGGTGFMGKVLVEKLLRSCPDIKNIYLLIRPKRGQEVKDRLNDLLNSPLFDSLRKENPNELSKVIPINGDITSEELGISESDQALLCRCVSVVFHSAATVKFDEKLKLSVTINMLGTKRLVELCHRMMSLDALIHISTAYCNCDRTEISEVIYTTPYHPDDIISLINLLPEDMLDNLTPALIGKRPNTYTFTKALAEQMLMKEAGNLPVAIVRPSIVTACHEEPRPGWVDNLNGPSGVLSAVGNGVFRIMMCEADYIADFIPVDTVINLVIVAAWSTAQKKSPEMTVYNCISSKQNPITWGRFVKLSIGSSIKYPLEGPLWYPGYTLTTNSPHNTCIRFLLHNIPAYLIDLFSITMGKKPIMSKVRQRLQKAVTCLEYFTMHQWRWTDDNVQAVLGEMNAKDRETFQFDVRRINWEKYLEQYVVGIREYLFKQSSKTLPASRKRMTRLYYLDQLTKIVMVVIAWRFLMARSARLRQLWSSFLLLIVKSARLIPFLSTSA